jgi:hypothetical protein
MKVCIERNVAKIVRKPMFGSRVKDMLERSISS